MTARQTPHVTACGTPAHVGDLARSLLNVAAEQAAAEVMIKEELLRAAESGDYARIVNIVTRWLDMPVVEVLGAPTPPS